MQPRNHSFLVAVAASLCASIACDGADAPTDDAFRLASEQLEDEDPAEAPDPTELPFVCVPFDGECVDKFNADSVIDLEAEDAELLFLTPCFHDGEASDGCVELEVALSNGNTAMYTLLDAPCSGVALRPLGQWQPGQPLPGSPGKPGVQTSEGFAAQYRDPACFGGYLALKRQLFRATSTFETDEHNYLGIPLKTDRTQVSILEVQTPDHWIDNVGYLGHYRYGGFVVDQDDPWANPVSDDPDDGWHTVLTIETTQHTALDGGEVCVGHDVAVFDHDGTVVEQPDSSYECSNPSGGATANPFEQRCKTAVNKAHQKSAVANVGFELIKGVCGGTTSTEVGFDIGAGLGGSVSGGAPGVEVGAEGDVGPRFDGSNGFQNTGGCVSAADELQTLAIGAYKSDLEKCLANPEQYLETPAPIITIVRGSRPAQTVGDQAGSVAPLWSCDLENGEVTSVACVTVEGLKCCTTQVREAKNCKEVGFMQCDCEDGGLISETDPECE